MSATVLVEGRSDRAALLVLAARRGIRHLDVVSLDGVTNVRKAVAERPGRPLVGLCDAGEERWFARALERYAVCDPDLEGELIRALGTDAVVAAIEAEGDGARLATFREQPFQRDRPLDAQLRRFLGTTSGRKERYARVLAEALIHEPAPLASVLDLAALA